MENKTKLSPNSLAFIALANEYCQTLEKAQDYTRDALQARMLKFLPRIYMSASDIDVNISYSEYEIGSYLDEEAYEQLRGTLASIMGEENTYLEVFIDDMKYSDTPIAAFISENLADLYQEFYNFISSIQNADTDVQNELLGLCKEDFRNFWGQELCNVLRALHNAYYNTVADELSY